MRFPILSLALIAAALLGEIQVAPPQSPTSYPPEARLPLNEAARELRTSRSLREISSQHQPDSAT